MTREEQRAERRAAKSRNATWPPSLDAAIIQMRHGGMTWAAIAAQVGRSHDAVRGRYCTITRPGYSENRREARRLSTIGRPIRQISESEFINRCRGGGGFYPHFAGQLMIEKLGWPPRGDVQ